jgi:hypothetical protein
MKPMPSSPVFLACLMAAALSSGCSQKKPAVAVPQTPAASSQQQPAPQASPAEAPAQNREAPASPTQGTPPPAPQPALQPAEPAQAASEKEKPETAKVKTAKPRSNGKKAGTETARNTGSKVVKPEAAEPAPATGQISPSLTNAEIAHDQASTEQLLQNTENTLNGIKRQLSQEEQAIMAQIRDYMKQSRDASKANDLTRAYNLAMKARLLSDDLAKRR